MVEAVLAQAESTGKLAASTVREFSEVMGRFALFMERGLGLNDVAAIGEAEIRAFIRSRTSDGTRLSVSLMHNRRTVCRYLFRAARGLGLCADDPTSGIDLPPRASISPRPLTDREVLRCRSHALFHPGDLRHPVAWAMAEATARSSEIPPALVGDVDMAGGSVRLPGSPRCAPRTVAFTDWGLVQVRRRLQTVAVSPDDPLFPMRSRRVPRSTASMALIEVLRAAGVTAAEVRPISVVGWRGALAYAGGASIEQVAALLGVRSLDKAAALIGLRPRETDSNVHEPAGATGSPARRSR